MAVVQFADPNPLPEGQRPSYDDNLIVSVKSAVFGAGDVDLFDILLFYKILADNAAESVAGEEEWLARSAAT